MKSKDYLSARESTQQAFADNLTDVLRRRNPAGKPRRIVKQQVQQWCSGTRRPLSDEIAVAIFEATGGQVTPNDSFDLPVLSAGEAAE